MLNTLDINKSKILMKIQKKLLSMYYEIFKMIYENINSINNYKSIEHLKRISTLRSWSK